MCMLYKYKVSLIAGTKGIVMFENKNLTNQKVLLRTDLNVPMLNGEILDEYRLEVALPTINLLLKKHAIIILLTHLGRPKKKDPLLSTQHLIPWFRNKGYAIQFIPNLLIANEIILRSHITLFLMENLRFFQGEQSTNPKKRNTFIKKIYQLGTFYVNDAFAVLHRADCSTAELPFFFSPEHRALGLLVKTELIKLHKICRKAKQPFLFIFGGNKLKSKMQFLFPLIKKIDTLALCPAVVFTFLQEKNQPIGASFTELDLHAEIDKFMYEIHKFNTQIIFPIDYLASSKNNFEQPLVAITAAQLKGARYGVTIGPKTVAQYINLINNSGTILYNGLMGSLEHPETLTSMKSIFKAMAYSPGKTIIAGGDSIAAVRLFNLTHKIDLISTGGGATIAYISGKQLLGLAPFKKELKSLLNNGT